MSYYFSKTVLTDFVETVERTKAALKEAGFGIITEIDIRQTLKLKFDIEFRNYRILGACNPSLAYEALQIEDKVGTMLPCNVVVQELANGGVEVAAVDPIASMQGMDIAALREVAHKAQLGLKRAIHSL